MYEHEVEKKHHIYISEQRKYMCMRQQEKNPDFTVKRKCRSNTFCTVGSV
jgi:hypothetical protein